MILFSAVEGEDYVGITDMVLRFEPNEFEKEVSVNLIDDTIVEFSEEFLVVLVPGDNETGVNFPRGRLSTVRILDDNDCKHFLPESCFATL